MGFFIVLGLILVQVYSNTKPSGCNCLIQGKFSHTHTHTNIYILILWELSLGCNPYRFFLKLKEQVLTVTYSLFKLNDDNSNLTLY